jgi:hypothetical protein
MGICRGYALWMASIIAVYLALPGLQAAMISLLGLSAAVAIVLGFALKRVVAPVEPPLLMAGASLFFAASGAIVWATMRGKQPSVPSRTTSRPWPSTYCWPPPCGYSPGCAVHGTAVTSSMP